ncbi:hypothetical protein CsSME_00034533 [Camellia sinensis var. sinensis]
MDMVLITQYFDTMKEIGASSKSSAVFIPHGPGAVREIAEQIRDGLLQASSAQQEATSYPGYQVDLYLILIIGRCPKIRHCLKFNQGEGFEGAKLVETNANIF